MSRALPITVQGMEGMVRRRGKRKNVSALRLGKEKGEEYLATGEGVYYLIGVIP